MTPKNGLSRKTIHPLPPRNSLPVNLPISRSRYRKKRTSLKEVWDTVRVVLFSPLILVVLFLLVVLIVCTVLVVNYDAF